MDSHLQDTGPDAGPEGIERRIVLLATAARGTRTVDGSDILGAVALDAAPQWAADERLPGAVGRLVVAVRRDIAVRSRQIPPHSVHPEMPHGDQILAAQLTGQAVMLALFRLISHPDSRPCPLCVVDARTVHELTVAGPTGLCAEHGHTTTRTESSQ